MNISGSWSLYKFELSRAKKSWVQGILGPLVNNSMLLFVFGSILGGRVQKIGQLEYAQFVVPGILTLYLLSASFVRGSISIYLARTSGRFLELQSAPMSSFEIVAPIALASVTRDILMLVVLIGMAWGILGVEFKFTNIIPFIALMILVSGVFSLLGILIALGSLNIEGLQSYPMLLIGPLVYLGGSFYSIEMLPHSLQALSQLNPVYHLISSIRDVFNGDAGPSIVAIITILLSLVFLLLVCINNCFKRNDFESL